MITNTYSKSSNSSGLNPILQKFHEMIWEIIVSKKMSGIFVVLSWTFFWNRKITKTTNISKSIYFWKIFAYSFEHLICTNKLEGFFFFFKSFFQGLGAFYTNAKPLIWMLYFRTKYLILHFFQARLFDFNIIFKTSFKNLFRKI